VERSTIMTVAKKLKNRDHMTAIIAPAIEGQFPGTLAQIKHALLATGFTSVIEVSEGAHETCLHEAEELASRKREGTGFMTTSCCSAYMTLVDKHLPFLENRRSSALSPMAYTAMLAKERNKDTSVIFIGPCLAKKDEAASLGTIDGVLTFSELASLFVAKDIDVREMDATDLEDVSRFEDCREFALSGGAAACVNKRAAIGDEISFFPVNGIDRKMARVMKTWEKRPVDADLVEVMCCEGGCINGPGVVVKPSVALRLRGGNRASSPVEAMRAILKPKE